MKKYSVSFPENYIKVTKIKPYLVRFNLKGTIYHTGNFKLEFVEVEFVVKDNERVFNFKTKYKDDNNLYVNREYNVDLFKEVYSGSLSASLKFLQKEKNATG